MTEFKCGYCGESLYLINPTIEECMCVYCGSKAEKVES